MRKYYYYSVCILYHELKGKTNFLCIINSVFKILYLFIIGRGDISIYIILIYFYVTDLCI